MQNEYLTTLALQPGATTKQIKSAYRRLSKKYHPDISKDENAKEKFIAINEAYKFLMDVGPRSKQVYHSQTRASYDYDPAESAYAEWRAKARKYAQWKAREAQKRQTELIKIVLRVFDVAALFILVFNATLVLDYLLPKQQFEFDSFSIQPIIEQQVHRYDDIIFEQYEFRLPAGNSDELRFADKATVSATIILNVPIKFELSNKYGSQVYEAIYNIYKVFGYLIPVALIFIGLYKYADMSLDNQLTVAIFLIIIALFQVYMFYKF